MDLIGIMCFLTLPPFSRNYNVILVNAPGADLIAERSEEIKQAAITTFTLSRSL